MEGNEELEKMKDCENKLNIIAMLFVKELMSLNGCVREKTFDALTESKIEYIKQKIEIESLSPEEKYQLKNKKEIIIRSIADVFKESMKQSGRIIG